MKAGDRLSLRRTVRSRYPCSVVDRIEIVVNGHALFVPRSLFCVLADLNTAEIDVNKRSSVLRLDGGDAAESFILKIEFDAKHARPSFRMS